MQDAVCANIRQLTWARGWTNAELARRSNVSYRAIYNMMQDGAPRPRQKTLDRIAGALGVSVELLEAGRMIMAAPPVEPPAEPKTTPNPRPRFVAAEGKRSYGSSFVLRDIAPTHERGFASPEDDADKKLPPLHEVAEMLAAHIGCTAAEVLEYALKHAQAAKGQKS